MKGNKIAVLGDMLELGPYEQVGHEMVGLRAAEVIDELIVIGDRAHIIAMAAQSAGLSARMITELENADVAIDFIGDRLEAEDVGLVKGSPRGMRMDGIRWRRVGDATMTQTSMALALAGFSFMMTVISGPPLLRVLRHFGRWVNHPG